MGTEVYLRETNELRSFSMVVASWLYERPTILP